MTTSLRNVEVELHLSVKWVSMALVALATVLVYVGDTRFESWARLRVLHFAIVFASGMLLPVQMTILALFILLRQLGLFGTLFSIILPYTALGSVLLASSMVCGCGMSSSSP